MIIMPEGEAIFHPHAIEVTIDDEAGGEFLLVHQNGEETVPGQIWINPADWPLLRQTINDMIANISEWESKTNK